MLKGFKNAAELDFSLEENKKKMEEAFQQIDAEKGSVYPLIIGGERIETEKCLDTHVPAARSLQKKRFSQRTKRLRHGV